MSAHDNELKAFLRHVEGNKKVYKVFKGSEQRFGVPEFGGCQKSNS